MSKLVATVGVGLVGLDGFQMSATSRHCGISSKKKACTANAITTKLRGG